MSARAHNVCLYLYSTEIMYEIMALILATYYRALINSDDNFGLAPAAFFMP